MSSDLYNFLKANASPIDIYFCYIKVSNKEIFRTFPRLIELTKFVDDEIQNYKIMAPSIHYDLRILTGQTQRFIREYEMTN